MPIMSMVMTCLFAEVCRQDLEGVVVTHLTGRYDEGELARWVEDRESGVQPSKGSDGAVRTIAPAIPGG
jgi:hypothetical protein